MNIEVEKDVSVYPHNRLLSISLENFRAIKKVYQDVLGLRYIDHLSINIINPHGEIVFLSSTPLTGINVFANNLQRHDYSIHPFVFSKNSFYWWDECYEPAYFDQLKMVKERENNLSTGFVCCERIKGFYLLYSFASRENGEEIKANIYDLRENFIAMGRHCYDGVRSIYQRYTSR